MDYYLILGIDWDASENEIKEAYRKMAQRYHPDHYDGDSAPFLKIQEAYQILSNPEQRRKYDRRFARRNLSIPQQSSVPTKKYTVETEPLIPIKDNPPLKNVSLFNSFETYMPSVEQLFDRLWRNFGQMESPKYEKAENLKVEVIINPEQAEKGGQLQLLIPVIMKCPLCYGSGSAGFWSCLRCTGYGTIKEELPLLVSYPGGIQGRFNKGISLHQFGITNFYLTVSIKVSEH